MRDNRTGLPIAFFSSKCTINQRHQQLTYSAGFDGHEVDGLLSPFFDGVLAFGEERLPRDRLDGHVMLSHGISSCKGEYEGQTCSAGYRKRSRVSEIMASSTRS